MLIVFVIIKCIYYSGRKIKVLYKYIIFRFFEGQPYYNNGYFSYCYSYNFCDITLNGIPPKLKKYICILKLNARSYSLSLMIWLLNFKM